MSSQILLILSEFKVVILQLSLSSCKKEGGGGLNT